MIVVPVDERHIDIRSVERLHDVDAGETTTDHDTAVGARRTHIVDGGVLHNGIMTRSRPRRNRPDATKDQFIAR